MTTTIGKKIDIINNSVHLGEKLFDGTFYGSPLNRDISTEMIFNPFSMSMNQFMNNLVLNIKEFNLSKYINKYCWCLFSLTTKLNFLSTNWGEFHPANKRKVH